MTDEAKALVERSVELAVNATCIADEYADVLRPKQIERLYAMRDLIETQAREIERLREALLKYHDLIEHQYCGSREAMNALQEADLFATAALKGTEK